MEKSKKSFLVGYTGFVGSNLCMEHHFDGLFNSKNINDAYGQNPDLLVYCGVPAQKFIANQNPEEDLDIIKNAINNIKKINPQKLVLISTIDVYPIPNGVDENSIISESEEAYGRNRHFLEKWVEENINDYLIVRLPGLYGKNLKKNFIFDLINYIPSMLNENKYNELVVINPQLKDYYSKQDNGFYKCKELSSKEKNILKEIFKKIGFSALNFTDSRGMFQFYNLSYLWNHIEIALKNNIKKINLATEPITISELYNYIYQDNFINELSGNIPKYDFKTKYDSYFHGSNGYILNKDFILNDIKNFVLSFDSKPSIAISNIGWEDINDEEMYEFLKEENIRNLEIAPTRLIADSPYNNLSLSFDISHNLMSKYGLSICSMQSIWFGKKQNIFESEENYKELVEYTKKAIDFARTINCHNLVFGNPKNRNMDSYEKDYPIAISFFKEIGEYALEKGIIIAVEPNPTIYNTNFLNTTEEAINFVEEINMPSIKINYDLGTVIENKEHLDILKQNISYINHIHISEPNLVPIEQRSIHHELLEVLKEMCYNKVISIEMKQTDLETVKKTIKYLKKIYGDIYGN